MKVRSAESRSRQETGSRQRKRKAFGQKTARATAIAARLTRSYPDLEVPLHHRNTFELLVAVILSAQCTDEAVNRVTPELFRRYPDPEAFAQTSTADIEQIIRPLGLFRAKAKSLKECARNLVEEFGGAVPATLEELTRLPGVGRKTANVILGHAFDTPGIIVDTHCKRLSRRLGLTRHQDPTKIEQDLGRLLPANEWTGFSHRLIIHGRRVCHSRNPACDKCVLNDLCPSRRAGTQSGVPGLKFIVQGGSHKTLNF
ncbi:MAG TPA: endonuclease III [Candidatus Binatia bacterium]|nr:endonuclease III [Candidatus Binatia bacterium]